MNANHPTLRMHRQTLGVNELDWVQAVRDFHEKFAPRVLPAVPGVPPEGFGQFYALGAIREEVDEIHEAAEDGDFPGLIDGLGDLVYVTIRAALIFGVDLRPVFTEIHRSNMAKVGGHLRPDGKVMKPPGWIPPDIRGCLYAQGWPGPAAPGQGGSDA